jgi:hypothetical protein
MLGMVSIIGVAELVRVLERKSNDFRYNRSEFWKRRSDDSRYRLRFLRHPARCDTGPAVSLY